MKTMHGGMVAVSLLSASAALALTHCSDSNGATGADGGHAGTSSGSGGGTSSSSEGGDDAGTGNGSSGGGSGNGGGSASGAGTIPTGDGGTGASADGGSSSGGMMTVTCQSPDGGSACDPGEVTCGSTKCQTSQTSCCHVAGDAGTDTCVGPNGACAGTLTRCNETSDCADGLVCCDSYGTTTCAASCGPYGSQACRSDSECGLQADAGAAKKCILQTCGGPNPGGPPTPVVTVELCAVQSFAAQGMAPTWGPAYGCTEK
jgi:hypothetical protein